MYFVLQVGLGIVVGELFDDGVERVVHLVDPRAVHFDLLVLQLLQPATVEQ